MTGWLIGYGGKGAGMDEGGRVGRGEKKGGGWAGGEGK